MVDSLCSWRLKIYYTTSDLVNKTGRVWILSVASPTAFTIRFPQDAIIVGLSAVSLFISLVDGRHVVSLPEGQQELSYLIGVVGSREQALIIVDEAERAINEAKTRGVEVAEAEVKLGDAKAALDAKRYAEAEILAAEAKQMAFQINTSF